ncbi:MAG: prephenate dehydratase domain-containing protein, partial [Bacteroidota bacterium]
MTVAYQGEPGAYSEAVIREAFGPEAKTVGFGTFAGAVASVHRGEADAAVIPVRNSQTGAVEAGAEAVADGLRAGLQSRGEVVLPVRHVLLALPGVSRGEIR